MSSLIYLTTIGIAILAWPVLAGAQNDELNQPQTPKDWLQQRKLEFEEYRFHVEAAQSSTLTMESRSLLNWSNAERGADVGAVYIWTRKGLPQLIACAFGRGKLLRHEFHSLSTESITAERGGATLHRFQPGIEWRNLSSAPPPAKARALRLVQMRRQAERFRVIMGNKERAEMRMLTQPVFRSPVESDEDVALFAFVQGTDPECMLVLDATTDGTWRYALARQTKWALKIELDGQQVTEFASVGRNAGGQAPFLVLKPPAAEE